LVWTHWRSTSGITGNQRNAYKILVEEFPPVYKKVKQIGEVEIPKLQERLDKMNAPYTPGKLPDLKL
jgi:hypothetical protein